MLLNKNTFKILSEFCSDYTKRIYGGQIAKKLKMNQKTTSNILNSLEKENVVKYATEGKNKYYFLNRLNPKILDIIKIIEIERKNVFVEKHQNQSEIFSLLEKRATGILVIFGSYANFTNNSKSDLDVFSLGKISEVKDLEERFNLKINIVKSSREKFNKTDIFIKEIIRNHIMLRGVEDFIELTW